MPSITARALISRYWGNGVLPSRHQAVRFRSESDLVLYLNNPPGIDASARGDKLQTLTMLLLPQVKVLAQAGKQDYVWIKLPNLHDTQA